MKNRIIKEATYEAGAEDGVPGPALIAHHKEIAHGGAAMTVVAYAAVSRNGRTFGTQLVVSRKALKGLKELTKAVHTEGGAVSIQLTHSGYFTDRTLLEPWAGPQQMGASAVFNPAGFDWSRAMTHDDIATVAKEFQAAAAVAQEAGFDCIQIHCGHGYLLAQFLSPFTNRRHDEYGGNLENRLRFPLAVIRRVRETVGEDFPLAVKCNVSDGFPSGISVTDSIRAAQAFESAGVDIITPSGGWISRNGFYMLRGSVPLLSMAIAQRHSWAKRMALLLFGRVFVPEIPWTAEFFREEARLLMCHLRGTAKVCLVGGIESVQSAANALQDGFDAVAMARALLRDPFLPNKWQVETTPMPCSHCNLCIVGSTMAETPVHCVERSW